MKSCIYKGHIAHRRFKPVRNEFRYGLFMLYLDLEELPSLFDDSLLWSYERASLANWRRRNYLGPRDLSLRDAVRFRIEDAGAKDPGGPVRMLTHMGYLGLCYNPVSFYYCFDKADKHVEVIIAEINNTPWKERHAYVLTTEMNVSGVPENHRFVLPKVFHVSPFMPMNVDYNWNFSDPGENLNVHMIDEIDGEKYFDATLAMSRSEMNRSNLNGLLLRYPLMTFKVIAGIYYQATKLWVKKTPFYENPEPRDAGIRDYYDTVEKAEEYRRSHANKSH